MSRENILEARCEHYRDVIRLLIGSDNPMVLAHWVDNWVDDGKITPNDAQYLYGFVPIEEATADTKKPPLGVMPRHIWDRRRQQDLAAATVRYLKRGMQIPLEWLEEYNEISDKEESNE